MDASAVAFAVPAGLLAGEAARLLASEIQPQAPARLALRLITATLVVAAAARFGWAWPLLPTAVLIVALTALSAIDLASRRLPDRLVFGALGLSLAAVMAAALGVGRPEALGPAVGGMALFCAALLAAHLISPRGLGFGDVKLGLLLGLHLGWAAGAGSPSLAAGAGQGSWPAVIRLVMHALMAGCLLGVAWGLAVALANRAMARRAGIRNGGSLWAQAFAFGPALAAGTLIVILGGDVLL